MTASQASHLIEQFASQCPLAIWILDSRGIAIFANEKLYEILEIKDSPSGAVGMNILQLPSIEKMNLTENRDKLLKGEAVTTTIHLENPNELEENLKIGRKKPLSLRLVSYVLKSSNQSIEHFVIFLEDITETRANHETLQEQAHDIQTFLHSKESRKERLENLKLETKNLKKKIKALGAEPVS